MSIVKRIAIVLGILWVIGVLAILQAPEEGDGLGVESTLTGREP